MSVSIYDELIGRLKFEIELDQVILKHLIEKVNDSSDAKLILAMIMRLEDLAKLIDEIIEG